MLACAAPVLAQESRPDGAPRPVPGVAAPPGAPFVPKRAPPAPFDRSRWVVTLALEGDGAASAPAPLEDTLTFANGRMASHVGGAQGFEPSSYESGPTWARIEVLGPNGRGKREYKLELAGEVLKGTLIATGPEGDAVRYAIAGRRAPVLEGTQWAIKIEPGTEAKQRGEASSYDAIEFVSGKVVCGKHAGGNGEAGDAPAPVSYVLATSGTRHVLTAEVTGVDGVRARWTAEFDGDTVKGTIRLPAKEETAEEGAEKTLTFQGLKLPDPLEVAQAGAASRPASSVGAPPNR